MNKRYILNPQASKRAAIILRDVMRNFSCVCYYANLWVLFLLSSTTLDKTSSLCVLFSPPPMGIRVPFGFGNFTVVSNFIGWLSQFLFKFFNYFNCLN